jgi:hypothetical protein
LLSETTSPQFSELSISDCPSTIGSPSSYTLENVCSIDSSLTSHLVKDETKHRDGKEDGHKPSTSLIPARRHSYRGSRSANQSINPYLAPWPTSSTSMLHLSTTNVRSTRTPYASGSTRTKPRSKQVSGVPNYNAKNARGDFCCEICPKVFKPAKRADWVRHVRTHYRDTEVGGQYCCCGIPVEQIFLPEYAERISLSVPVETYNGKLMIGGCGRYFSRRDALKRHLMRTSKHCVGDVDGDWHP